MLHKLKCDKELLATKYIEVWNKIDKLEKSKLDELKNQSKKNSTILPVSRLTHYPCYTKTSFFVGTIGRFAESVAKQVTEWFLKSLKQY